MLDGQLQKRIEELEQLAREANNLLEVASATASPSEWSIILEWHQKYDRLMASSQAHVTIAEKKQEE